MVRGSLIWGRILLSVWTFLIYLFLYMPIFVMAVFSFNSSTFSSWTGFSLRWYKQLFFTPEIVDALVVSLLVAFFSSILSVFLGTSFVLATRWIHSKLLSYSFYSSVILPDIMIAVCVLSAFAFFGVPVGYVSLISGHTVIGVGFVIPIISSRLSEIDPVLTEASLDLGATYFQTFRKIWLPWLMPAIIASGLLVFAISMDDFLIAFFCSSPTVQTLSVYIYSMIKTGVDPTINAISTLMLAITSFLVLLLFRLNILDRVIHSE